MIKVHFMGIGGSGASAIAAIARSQGFEVSGCDKASPFNEFTKDLPKDKLFEGHSASHPGGGSVDILAISPAISVLDPDNPELLEAKKLGIKIMTWQEFMGEFLEKDKFVIAVCGSHGKSTTTAMIGQLLEDAGFDPIVELGAIVPIWGKNYRVSKGVIPAKAGIHTSVIPSAVEGSQDKNADSGRARMTSDKGYFITEADEFNDNFLVSHPDITVITNIDFDHPEFFSNLEAYKGSFKKFLLQTKQTIVANLEDENVADVLKVVMKESKVSAVDYNKIEVNLDLKISGKHNLQNALAAFQVGIILGIEPEIIIKSLNDFAGIERRQELIGIFKGSLIYSDFGHHPTEIKATVEALKQKHPDKKLWMVFQPHMFSRTKALFSDFVKVFKSLPLSGAIITDIYPSREIDTGLVHSEELIKAIGNKDIVYVKNKEEILDELTETCTPEDVIIFQGAGDIDKWARELVEN